MFGTVLSAAERLGERVRARSELPAPPFTSAVRLRRRRHGRPARAFGLRALVWLRRAALDWRLARHPELSRSRQLRLRAEQLTCPAMRAALAGRVERILEATAYPNAVTARVCEDRVAVVEAYDELLELAAALRTVANPSPFGIAMVIRLLTDAMGPLYLDDPPATLRDVVRAILAELRRT